MLACTQMSFVNALVIYQQYIIYTEETLVSSCIIELDVSEFTKLKWKYHYLPSKEDFVKRQQVLSPFF